LKKSKEKKVVLADSAHLANMDHPEQFQKVVDSFLDEIKA